jgi:predicted alpha/beta superfamily hydrolase
MNYPQTFGSALVVSPALWWGERAIFGDVQRHFEVTGSHPRIWLDVGLLEGEEAVSDVRALHTVMLQWGWGAPNLRYVEQPDGAHDEASWAGRFEGMLRFLYETP